MSFLLFFFLLFLVLSFYPVIRDKQQQEQAQVVDIPISGRVVEHFTFTYTVTSPGPGFMKLLNQAVNTNYQSVQWVQTHTSIQLLQWAR